MGVGRLLKVTNNLNTVIPNLTFEPCRVLTFVEPSPSRHIGSFANMIRIILRYTDWHNIGLEDDGLVEAEESQVVLKGPSIELGMGCYDLNPSLHVAVGLLLFGKIKFSDSEEEVRWGNLLHATERIRGRLVSVRISKLYFLKSKWFPLL